MAAYLAELDASDANDGELEIDPAAVQQALEVLRREHDRLQCAEQHLAQSGARVTTTEPEARCMKGHGPAYNVQTVVDNAHHLIIAHEVTDKMTRQSQSGPHGRDRRRRSRYDRL